MDLVSALRIGQADDATVQPAEEIEALFAKPLAVIFPGHDGMVEDLLTAFEIQSMLAEVGSALLLVPRRHQLNVDTKK